MPPSRKERFMSTPQSWPELPPIQTGLRGPLPALRRRQHFRRISETQERLQPLRPRLQLRRPGRRSGLFRDLFRLRTRGRLRHLAGNRLHRSLLGASGDDIAADPADLHPDPAPLEGLAGLQPVFLQGRGRPTGHTDRNIKLRKPTLTSGSPKPDNRSGLT